MFPELSKIPYKRLGLIHDYFMDTKEQICTVESCTGGLLSFWLTALPGASQYFKGGLVSYKMEIKKKELGISDQIMRVQGLTTAHMAQSMAQSVKLKWSSDWAISTTGVAGPQPGKLGENVGKIAFSVCSPHGEKSLVKQLYDTYRHNFRYKASLFALDFLISEFK